MKKKRLIYLLATIALFGVETLIALFVNDRFVRPFFGDVLVVILVYCFIRIFIPEKCRLLPLYVFLFACFIEWMQYLNLVALIGLPDNLFGRVVRVALGTSFDWHDILCYAVGCVIANITTSYSSPFLMGDDMPDDD